MFLPLEPMKASQGIIASQVWRGSLARLLTNSGGAKPDPDAQDKQDDQPKHQNCHAGSAGRLDVRGRCQDRLGPQFLRVAVRSAVRLAVTAPRGWSHASTCSRLGRPRETPNMGHSSHDGEMSADCQDPESRNNITRKETEGEDKHALGACQETD